MCKKSYLQGSKTVLQTNLKSATGLYVFFNMFRMDKKHVDVGLTWCQLSHPNFKPVWNCKICKVVNDFINELKIII